MQSSAVHFGELCNQEMSASIVNRKMCCVLRYKERRRVVKDHVGTKTACPVCHRSMLLLCFLLNNKGRRSACHLSYHSELAEDAKARLAARLTPQMIPPGHDLCQEGDEADCMWILQEGMPALQPCSYRRGVKNWMWCLALPRIQAVEALCGQQVVALRHNTSQSTAQTTLHAFKQWSGCLHLLIHASCGSGLMQERC